MRLKDTETRDGRKHRRGVDTLSSVKFSPKTVVNAVTEIFGTSDYRKVLVVSEVEDEAVIEKAESQFGIEVWKMPDILKELRGKITTRAYRDDVLRTLQLVSGRTGS